MMLLVSWRCMIGLLCFGFFHDVSGHGLKEGQIVHKRAWELIHDQKFIPINIPKILGGEDAIKGSYPWQISLTSYGQHICGGSVIADQWIVTAGHCCLSHIGSYNVIAGEHDTRVNEGTEQIFKVQKVIKLGTSERNENDTCLMKICGQFRYTEWVLPISIASSRWSNISEDNIDLRCVATGWGVTETGRLADVLQVVKLQLVPTKQCQEMWKHNYITADMICAGYLKGGRDTCSGDSGGPLACMLNEKWTLVGVTSMGSTRCGEPNKPGVYSRTSFFYTWIQNEIYRDASNPECT